MSPGHQANMLETATEQSGFPLCITSAVIDSPEPTKPSINEAFVRLTGYRREALTGSTPRIYPAPTIDRARPNWPEVACVPSHCAFTTRQSLASLWCSLMSLMFKASGGADG